MQPMVAASPSAAAFGRLRRLKSSLRSPGHLHDLHPPLFRRGVAINHGGLVVVGQL